MKKSKNLFNAGKTLSIAAFISFDTAAAGLPKKEAPSSGGTTTMEIVKGYLGDTIAIAAMGVCVWAFLRVASNALTAYGEITDGKGSYKELGTNVVIGIGLVIGTIWLANEATDIFI